MKPKPVRCTRRGLGLGDRYITDSAIRSWIRGSIERDPQHRLTPSVWLAAFCDLLAARRALRKLLRKP